MSNLGRWLTGNAWKAYRKRHWLHVMAICSLIGATAPEAASAAVPDEGAAEAAFQHLKSGMACVNARNLVCADKEVSWLASSAFPEVGNVLLGSVLFHQGRFEEALNAEGSAYRASSANGAGPRVQGLSAVAHKLAGSVIGEAKFALKRPDREVLPFLLESVEQGLPEGVLIEDGALEYISVIYQKQGYLGLSFGFGLERYNQLAKEYAHASPGPRKKQLEQYIHAWEFQFAVLLAGVNDIAESGEWLKKAINYQGGDYLKRASEIPQLKPALESIGALKQPPTKPDHD